MFGGAVLCWSLAAIAPAAADDFASDLASCAKAPIEATKFAVGQSRKAAEFAVNHGSCVPPVIAGDPLLYGLTGAVVVLQGALLLPHGAQACVDASFGQSSRPVAHALDVALNDAPVASALVPAEGRTLLRQIANNQSNATLRQVPGIGLVMDHVTCACAVASSGLDIHELKEQVGNVIESVEGCAGLPKKILTGAYDATKSAVKGVYNGVKDAINSVGCTFGLGGCSSGPPFFCTGYNAMRGQNMSREQIAAIFPAIFDAGTIQAKTRSCEQKWVDAVAAHVKAQHEAEEQAKADKLGAANALGFAFRWIPKCFEEVCKSSISNLANLYAKDIQSPETTKQYQSFALAKAALDEKYGALAEVAIAISKDRHDKALRADLNAPPIDRLGAFGCTLYLGRARQSLCAKQEGFGVCRDYVNAGAWDMCALAGTPGLYAAGAGLNNVLRNAGCIPGLARARLINMRGEGRDDGRSESDTSRTLAPVARAQALRAQCLSARARIICDSLKSGNSAVACEGPEVLAFHRTLDRLPPLREPLAPLTPVRGPRGMITTTPRAGETPPPPLAPTRAPLRVQPISPATSTICEFDTGPRAGQRQDYAPMAPIAVGSSCQDGRGSTGRVVAP